MSIRTHSCVTVVCDGCGGIPECDEGEVHYSSVEEAERYLVDERDPERSWEFTAGRHVCPDCLCRRDGHPWGEPIRCGCDGTLPGHGGDCRVLWRDCPRCGDVEDDGPGAR